MSATSVTLGAKANGGGGVVTYRPTQESGLVQRLMQKAHELWPIKATHGLAASSNTSPRSVERWSQGKGGISAEALANLIRSDHGFQFLTAIMADAQPKWWRVCAALMDANDAQRLQMQARRRLRRVIRGALDADVELTASIARADSLLVHDADFARPHADALRSMGGLSHRAVAKADKK